MNNFDKVGKTKVSWSVTKSTECDLGKWLLEQENKNESFTKTENWKQLKINHDMVHSSVQDYINEDCKNTSDNNVLNNLSGKLDNATMEVFKCLDQIKKDNMVKKVVADVSNVAKATHAQALSSSKVFEPVKNTNHTISTNQKSTVIASSTKDDDEWESF